MRGSQDCSRNQCNTWKRCAARLSSSFPGIVKCTLAPECMWWKKATVYGRTIFNYTWKLIIFGTSHFWEEHRQQRNVLIKNSNSPSNDFTWHSRMSKPWIRFHSHKLDQIDCNLLHWYALIMSLQHSCNMRLGTGHCRNYVLVHHGDRCLPIWQLLATAVN